MRANNSNSKFGRDISHEVQRMFTNVVAYVHDTQWNQLNRFYAPTCSTYLDHVSVGSVIGGS